VVLNVARRDAVVTALHDETQDGEPHRVAQCGQLLGVAVKLRGHELLLIFSNRPGKPGSEILEGTPKRLRGPAVGPALGCSATVLGDFVARSRGAVEDA
jgi:hypothetical protein